MEFVEMVIGRLRSDDIYNQVCLSVYNIPIQLRLAHTCTHHNVSFANVYPSYACIDEDSASRTIPKPRMNCPRAHLHVYGCLCAPADSDY